jgi:hypothetical protein
MSFVSEVRERAAIFVAVTNQSRFNTTGKDAVLAVHVAWSVHSYVRNWN